MKKTIAVVALDPRAAAFYAGQIESLFHDYAEVRSYSVRDGSAQENCRERICLPFPQTPTVRRRKWPGMCP